MKTRFFLIVLIIAYTLVSWHETSKVSKIEDKIVTAGGSIVKMYAPDGAAFYVLKNSGGDAVAFYPAR